MKAGTSRRGVRAMRYGVGCGLLLMMLAAWSNSSVALGMQFTCYDIAGTVLGPPEWTGIRLNYGGITVTVHLTVPSGKAISSGATKLVH